MCIFADMKILIVNGPNLNMLGKREPAVYGNDNMDKCLAELRSVMKNIGIDYFQSNHEGELIDCLQQADEKYDGIVLNAGAYTHTSVALLDCILAIDTPVVEVHISNVHAREDFRRRSVIAPACRGIICGFGLGSYRLAVESFLL